jgi:hypothetical protein
MRWWALVAITALAGLVYLGVALLGSEGEGSPVELVEWEAALVTPQEARDAGQAQVVQDVEDGRDAAPAEDPGIPSGSGEASAGAGSAPVLSRGAAPRTPPPGVVWNEPPGFEVVIDEDWSSFDRYDWWHTPTNQGSAEIHDGRLVWTYPEGKRGGSVPGAKIVVERQRHGPYQYHRDEGVTVSENFHGHRSGVNKFRYFNDASASGRSPVGFFGNGDAPLVIGINSVWGGPHYDARLRWDSPGNLASPARPEAIFTRGVPHTVETLLYIGTPGNTDGWIKLWLDGVLILHFQDLGVVGADENPVIRGIHFAPVWGGTEDVVPATQTLTVDHSYVSTGNSVPSTMGG